jgi:transcriptional regulator with XRE-family HTH domain
MAGAPSEADAIVGRLSQKLKAVRKDRRLTLDELAQRSGVSRSMLSQIERGETNPTVATLWSLTRALGVDFAGLFDEPATGHIREVMTAEHTPRIERRAEKCRITILSPPTLAGQYELYDLTFEVGGALGSTPHRPGCEEHLTVLDGRIKVTSGSEETELNVGDTARYRADVAHEIAALGQKPARAILVVVGS